MRIGDIRHTARVEKQKQTSLAAKVSFETTKLKETMDRRTDPRDAKKLEENLELAHAWSDYLQALGKITVGLTSSEQGYNAYRGHVRIRPEGGRGRARRAPARMRR